jgi:hypothetical protein
MKDLILRNEPYITQYKPRRIAKDRLILRDEYGRIRAVTKGPSQERQLLTLGARIKLDPKTCRSIKRRGFKHSIIQTGIYRNPITHQREYRRYQIFKATPYTHDERIILHNFFKKNIPKQRIGFYVWHNAKLYTKGEYCR